MKKCWIALFLSLSILTHAEVSPILLERVTVNTSDKASILRGAKFFATTCMTCHTMKYLQNNDIGKQAGITLDKMPINIKEWWLGIVPPDLTLIARVRGADWLYTYFHSFYKDPSRPTGFNNLVAKDINMMNIFLPFQGEQQLSSEAVEALKTGSLVNPHYFSVLNLVKAGSMSPDQFDETMKDLVNFLVYASDPTQNERKHIGIWVLLFLTILAVMAYLLKKLYWKNIH